MKYKIDDKIVLRSDVKVCNMSNDNVNNPSHYTQGKYEVIEVIEDWGLDKDFYLANTIKYIARAEHKGKYEEDLKKAMFYLNRKLEKMGRCE